MMVCEECGALVRVISEHIDSIFENGREREYAVLVLSCSHRLWEPTGWGQSSS